MFRVEFWGLMRIVRGMQRLICEEKINKSILEQSFTLGIGVTVPKARARDKPLGIALFSGI